MANEKKESVNPLLRRYAPNQRFITGAYKNQKDVTLAGKRGAISSLMPSQQAGLYMFEDGEYDRGKDFSYILRKDLSIVDIDRYTERLKKELATADESLVDSINAQLTALQDRKHMEEVLQSVKNDSGAKSE